MWQEYTHCAPLLVDGKDILDILDREDDLISKNVPFLHLYAQFRSIAIQCLLIFLF